MVGCGLNWSVLMKRSYKRDLIFVHKELVANQSLAKFETYYRNMKLLWRCTNTL
jgi:hypothetical protein